MINEIDRRRERGKEKISKLKASENPEQTMWRESSNGHCRHTSSTGKLNQMSFNIGGGDYSLSLSLSLSLPTCLTCPIWATSIPTVGLRWCSTWTILKWKPKPRLTIYDEVQHVWCINIADTWHTTYIRSKWMPMRMDDIFGWFFINK